MERAATTASSLEAEQDSGNINRTQSMATLNESSPQGTGSGSGPRCKDTILGGAKAQTRFEAASKQSNDPPLSRVNTLGSGEDSMKLKELMEICTKLSEFTIDNGEIEITATIDGKVKIVTEASVRRHLKLEDSNGVSNLPTTKIFKQLALMDEGSTVPVESHHIPTGALSTSKPHLSPTLRSSIRQETEVSQPSSPPYTNVANKAASIGVDVRHGGAATTVTSLDAG
ncbi:hypothetical protein Tco_0041125 [Tanacetum coccineum]